ncbi:phosphate ABC transporter substrate-binding protein PstS [Nocardioides mesophilus]|uniref:phosphate ABC transporter substrate-binding protein PstS n=1 Tax=Nocardioides mesophilus TaxID=433659 RepID=UPI001CB7112F|nr:phosphate ABC transporter substrate-binding protein PstS [Nocardioides mesophilus]
MNTTSIRRLAAPAALLALGLSLTACGAANEQPAAGAEGGSDSSLSGTLNGAGSSAQEAAQGAWQAGFQQANPDVTVNYDPVGSGGGREQFIAGGTAFAGSDAYLSEEDGEVKGAQDRCNGEPAIEIPDYVSPIALIYNLDGVDELKLDPATVAGIFAGDITKWNDPAITATNPDADLPDAAINPVHRADDSGTTDNFTSYLSAADPDVWTYGEVGEWPIKSGEAANGTSGVVSAVQNGSNSIGYADASQAGDLGVAEVKVGDEYVGPSAEAAAKVLEISPRVEGRSDVSMAVDLDRNTTESGAYPIVLTSYLIACQTYDDQQTADLVKGYLTYVVSDEGQQAAADTAGSAPLSDSLQEEAQGIIDGISAKS